MKQSRATEPQVKDHIEKTLQNKTHRPSTRAIDAEAARACSRKESEIRAMNAENEKLSRTVSKRIFGSTRGK